MVDGILAPQCGDAMVLDASEDAMDRTSVFQSADGRFKPYHVAVPVDDAENVEG